MKPLLLAASLASLAFAAAPGSAAEFGPDARSELTILPAAGPLVLERHGHRADDPAGDDHMERRGRRGGHGGRARVPGGSGCDDPHDLIEHPECRA